MSYNFGPGNIEVAPSDKGAFRAFMAALFKHCDALAARRDKIHESTGQLNHNTHYEQSQTRQFAFKRTPRHRQRNEKTWKNGQQLSRPAPPTSLPTLAR